GLAAKPHGENDFVLYDTLGIGQAVVLSQLAVEVAQQFDGDTTFAEIADVVKEALPGAQVSTDVIAGLAAALDEALFLESPRFDAHLDIPIRQPVCASVNSGGAPALKKQLTSLFTSPGGPGLPENRRANTGKLRAVLVPHMDYGRGGVTYGHGFKELI